MEKAELLLLGGMKFVSTILTFILLFTSLAYGAEEANQVPTEEEEIPVRKMIVLNMNNVKNMNVSSVSFIRKSVIEAIFAAKTFEITLGRVDKSIGKNKLWYEVRVEHKVNEKGLSHLKFYLIEKPSNMIINYISEDNLIRAKVQYRSRVLAYKLMFGKWFNEKNGMLIKPIIVNLKKTNNSKNNKNEFLPEDEEEEEEDLSTYPEGKDKKPKTKTKTSKAKKKTKTKPLVPKKKDKEVSLQKFSSPDLNLIKNNDLRKKDTERNLEWMSRFDYSFGYQKESVFSSSVLSETESLETETLIQRVAIKASSSMKVKGWIQHFHYGLSLSSTIAEEQYQIAPRINLYGNFNYDLYSSFVFLGLNMEFDKLGFVNIATRGEGLKAFSSNIVWVGVGLRYIDEIKGHTISLEVDMKQAMIANSNASSSGDDVPLDGNKLHVQGRVSIYKDWGVGMSYEAIRLSSISTSDLENNHSIVGMYLTYN